MKCRPGLFFFAATEIFIGAITFAAVVNSLIQGKSTKTPEVLTFVLSAAAISTILGFGLLKHNLTCYRILLYFSSVIILSKVLILAGIISLNGALETSIPSSFKNFISVIYHGLLMLYLLRKPLREEFAGKCKFGLFCFSSAQRKNRDA